MVVTCERLEFLLKFLKEVALCCVNQFAMQKTCTGSMSCFKQTTKPRRP